MKRSSAFASVFLLALSVIPASANSIPISGAFSGTGTGGSGTTFTESFTGSGSDTTFGSFSATESATVNVDTTGDVTLSNGTFTWDFANGFISGTFSGSGMQNSVAITFLITSGLLPGDTGSATGTGSFDNVTNAVSGSYSGSIIAPGEEIPGLAPLATPLPSTWTMLLAAFAGFAFLVVRGSRRYATTIALMDGCRPPLACPASRM